MLKYIMLNGGLLVVTVVVVISIATLLWTVRSETMGFGHLYVLMLFWISGGLYLSSLSSDYWGEELTPQDIKVLTKEDSGCLTQALRSRLEGGLVVTRENLRVAKKVCEYQRQKAERLYRSQEQLKAINHS